MKKKSVTAREIWAREDFVGTRADAIRIAQQMNAETEDMLGELPMVEPVDPVHPGQMVFNWNFEDEYVK